MTTELTLKEHLAVPYVLVVYSIERDGEWVRHAEYPELDGLYIESTNTIEAIHKLDTERVRTIESRVRSGEPVPVPRPPLHSMLRDDVPTLKR
jgi:hypothetical protein